MALLFASDFALSSSASVLPHPRRSFHHSPITPLDVVFASTDPSDENYSLLLHPEDEDEGGAHQIVVPQGRRMSKSFKIPPQDKRNSLSSTTSPRQSSIPSSYTAPPESQFSSQPPPYSTNERSHTRRTSPSTPLELSPPLNDSRARSHYFPESPGSTATRRQSSQTGESRSGRRMSSISVAMERRTSLEHEKAQEFRAAQEIVDQPQLRRAQASSPAGTIGFESCIAGALAHEKKARSYGEGASTKALHHFTRANDLLSLALQERPSALEALVYKSSVIHTLAIHYLPPTSALHTLQSLVQALRNALVPSANPPPTHQIIAAKTQLASLTHLLATLIESLHLSLLPRAIWAGETGDLIRESVKLWTQVLASESSLMVQGSPALDAAEWGSGVEGSRDEMVKHRSRRSSSVCNRAVSHSTMVDGYFKLADAASFAAGLAVELLTADTFFDLAEDALTSALKMAALVDLQQQTTPQLRSVASFHPSAASGPPSSLTVAKVRLRTGALKIERLRQTNVLAPQLPINHAQGRAVVAEMQSLSQELGSILEDTPSTSTSAIRTENKTMYVRSLAQLGDAQFILAQLLKRTWRKKGGLKVNGAGGRKGSTASFDQAGRKQSTASTSSSISDSDSLGAPALSSSAVPRRMSETSRRGSQQPPPRQGSFTIHEDEEEEEGEGQDAGATRAREIEEAQSLVGRFSSLSTGFGSGRSSVSNPSPIEAPTSPRSPRRSSVAPVPAGIRKASVPPSFGLDRDKKASLPSSFGAHKPSPLSGLDNANVVFTSPFGTPPADSTLLQTGYQSPSTMGSFSTQQRRPSHAIASTPPTSMSMAAYRRASAAGSAMSDGGDEPLSPTMSAYGGTSMSGWAQRKPSVMPFSNPASLSTESLQFPLSPTAPASYSSSELATQAWELLTSSVKNHKTALSLLKPVSTTSSSVAAIHLSSAPFASSPSNIAYQRATLLLAISSTSYFRASLASRVQAAKESQTSLLVTAEVYATWAAKELGWDWIIEDNPRPDGSENVRANGTGLVDRVTVLGMKALFTLMRTTWHKAVTGVPGEVHKEEKKLAKDKVERMTMVLRGDVGVGPYDVTRYKIGLEKLEGEFESGESLYWSNVSKNLKDGLRR